MTMRYIVAFLVIESLLLATFQCDMVVTNNLMIFFIGFWVANNIKKNEGGTDD